MTEEPPSRPRTRRRRPRPLPTGSELRDQLFSRPMNERMAMGVALRERCRRRDLAVWEPGDDRPDPIDLLMSRTWAASRSSSRSASGGCWPRRSRSTVAAPRSWPPTCHAAVARPARLGVRRRPSPQLRGVRHARAEDGVRHQRLRRDGDRAVRLGRQAPGASFVVAGRANGFTAADARAAAPNVVAGLSRADGRVRRQPVLDVWYSSPDPFDLHLAAAAEIDVKPAVKRLRSPRSGARTPASSEAGLPGWHAPDQGRAAAALPPARVRRPGIRQDRRAG